MNQAACMQDEYQLVNELQYSDSQ